MTSLPPFERINLLEDILIYISEKKFIDPSLFHQDYKNHLKLIYGDEIASEIDPFSYSFEESGFSKKCYLRIYKTKGQSFYGYGSNEQTSKLRATSELIKSFKRKSSRAASTIIPRNHFPPISPRTFIKKKRKEQDEQVEEPFVLLGRKVSPGINLFITQEGETVPQVLRTVFSSKNAIPLRKSIAEETLSKRTLIVFDTSKIAAFNRELLLEHVKKNPGKIILFISTKENCNNFFSISTFIEGRKYA